MLLQPLLGRNEDLDLGTLEDQLGMGGQKASLWSSRDLGHQGPLSTLSPGFSPGIYWALVAHRTTPVQGLVLDVLLLPSPSSPLCPALCPVHTPILPAIFSLTEACVDVQEAPL